jgi:quercetin dioxygenase-like cupin family protein
MRTFLTFVVTLVLCCSALAQTVAKDSEPKPAVLQKNEGEVLTRRPRDIPMPNSDFMLKVSPQSGSKHFVLGTEEIPPGGLIAKHKHHGQDEILLIQTGTAHIWLGDKEYDGLPGSLVFIPSETWIGLKNTGKENISLVFIFNEPGFDEMMRCVSVPKGQPASHISKEELRACSHNGHAEFEALETPPAKKP